MRPVGGGGGGAGGRESGGGGQYCWSPRGLGMC